MADGDWIINGRTSNVLALSYIPGGEVNVETWNAETEDWEPTGSEYRPDRYVINQPVSSALTELIQFDGNYELAYQGIDHLPGVFSGTESAGIKWWQELIVSHSTDVDWISHHSGDLT